MNYYISDLHFGHANVILHDNRPFADVEEMDRVLIRRWNDVVGGDDDVYVVGDFCYRSGKTADWYLRRLKGRMRTLPHALNAAAAINGYAPVPFDRLVENNLAHNAGAFQAGTG